MPEPRVSLNDMLYFCDCTCLCIGAGDISASTDAERVKWDTIAKEEEKNKLACG